MSWPVSIPLLKEGAETSYSSHRRPGPASARVFVWLSDGTDCTFRWALWSNPKWPNLAKEPLEEFPEHSIWSLARATKMTHKFSRQLLLVFFYVVCASLKLLCSHTEGTDDMFSQQVQRSDQPFFICVCKTLAWMQTHWFSILILSSVMSSAPHLNGIQSAPQPYCRIPKCTDASQLIVLAGFLESQ